MKKRKLYLDYLEEINESSSREKKISDAVKKIKKFLVNDKIINFLIKEIVDTETSKGVKYLVWLANLVKDEILSQAKKENENFYINFKKYIETGKSYNEEFEKFESFIDQQLDDTYYDYDDILTIGFKVPYIMDWIKSPIHQGNIDLSKYKTLNNVFDEAKEWYKELHAISYIHEEHGKIILKDNIDVFKKLETINLFEIIWKNKDDKNINNLINILIGRKFSYPEIDGHLEINSDFVIVDCNFCLKLLRNEVRFQLLLSPHSNFDSIQCYRLLLKNFYDFDLIMKYVKSDTTIAKIISNKTISKIKHFKDWSTKVREIYNSYVQNIFPDKMKTEIKLIFKTIKDKTEIDIFKKGEHYVFKMPIMTFIDNIFRTKYDINFTHGFYKATSISDGLSNLYKNIKEEFNNLKYEPQYNFITEVNEYIINNIDKVNESVINEKLGVADDIEEWWELIYYIIIKQCEGFVKIIKENPKKFKDVIQINNDFIKVWHADIILEPEQSNKLISNYISNNNKLKLKDLILKLSITILKEEDFTNYLFDTDAYYNDKDADFDGTYLKGSEIFLQIYLPNTVLDKDNSTTMELLMDDYEITLKLRQSLSHELDHAYEFFNRISFGEIYFPEKSINIIQQKLQHSKFSQISNDFYEFLSLCYLALTFESSARVTEINYIFKDLENIDNNYFWSVVKNSNAWKEMQKLKDFDPVSFYNNIKFEMSDEDIKEVLIQTKIYTENDFEKNSVKDLVIRYWLKMFDDMIALTIKETLLDIKRINKQMFDHPLLFFKYYDKKFKKSWEYFYTRIVRMATLYVKN